MPDIESGGATTVEGLSIAIDLNLMKMAGLHRSNIVAYNDNADDIIAVNEEKTFQGVTRAHV